MFSQQMDKKEICKNSQEKISWNLRLQICKWSSLPFFKYMYIYIYIYIYTLYIYTIYIYTLYIYYIYTYIYISILNIKHFRRNTTSLSNIGFIHYNWNRMNKWSDVTATVLMLELLFNFKLAQFHFCKSAMQKSIN